MRLLPTPIFNAEGLAVAVSPEGAAVFRLCEAGEAQLEPDRAVALAFELLDQYAPALLEAIDREVRSQRLRLVQRPGGGGDAA